MYYSPDYILCISGSTSRSATRAGVNGLTCTKLRVNNDQYTGYLSLHENPSCPCNGHSFISTPHNFRAINIQHPWQVNIFTQRARMWAWHHLTKREHRCHVKKVIKHNTDTIVAMFDLELHNNCSSLYIFAWKTNTLLVREWATIMLAERYKALTYHS